MVNYHSFSVRTRTQKQQQNDIMTLNEALLIKFVVVATIFPPGYIIPLGFSSVESACMDIKQNILKI